jgi:hypothetical protein
MSPRIGPSATLLSLAAILVLGGSALAQRGSDLLDQFKNKQAVAAQQFENEIRDAVAQAAKAEPAKAIDILKDALKRVEADELLSATRRDTLARDLRERIRVAAIDVQRGAAIADEDARRKAQLEAIKAGQNKNLTEQEKLARQVEQVRALREQGRIDEANRLAAELAEKNPNNPSVQAVGRTGTTSDRLKAYYEALNERERRLLAARIDIDRAAMPPKDDIEFPSPEKWREITKLRKNTQQLTEKEKEILKGLSTPITVDFKGSKFQDVLEWFSDKLGLDIIVDKQALEQLMITYDTPVSVKASRISSRTVLRKILGDLGLTYVVKDQTVQVMTPEMARGLLTTRVYYIGDLVGQVDFSLPPALNQLQMAQNITGLLDYITKNVDPDSWAVNERGGLGTIAYDPIRGAIIVKQSAEVHYFLGASLR